MNNKFFILAIALIVISAGVSAHFMNQAKAKNAMYGNMNYQNMMAGMMNMQNGMQSMMHNSQNSESMLKMMQEHHKGLTEKELKEMHESCGKNMGNMFSHQGKMMGGMMQ